MKIALLEAYGYNAREIADKLGCTHAHVRNLRTHPDFRLLLREFYEGRDFDGSLAFRVYEQRLARLSYTALETLESQLGESVVLDDGTDTGIPQAAIRQGAAKEILGAVGRHVMAHARAVAPAAGSGGGGGGGTIHIHLGSRGKGKVFEVEVESDDGETKEILDG